MGRVNATTNESGSRLAFRGDHANVVTDASSFAVAVAIASDNRAAAY